MKQLSIATLCLLMLFSACTEAEKPKVKEDKTPAFQTLIDSIYQANPDMKGLMVHVEAPDQGISWSGAIGVADTMTQKALEVDQPALIASNTKTYVSVAILRLVEMGKIKLDASIQGLISEKTDNLLRADGYDTEAIKVMNLLSHTSGIFDYVSADAYFEKVLEEPMHRWTRDEQIKLGMTDGEPHAQPGETFSYADINYLLLTEIIEQQTDKSFYTAIRELLKYKELGLTTTWFESLEDRPANAKALVHQYESEMKLNSYTIDPSFDLYGGGGIAATTKDLALFSQNLFEKKLFDKPETLDLIYTTVTTKDTVPSNYYLGLSLSEINGKKAYGHGGFWGTVVNYFPEYNASIAVFILEREKRKLTKQVREGILRKL